MAANAFDLEMPAVRIWLTLYAQDLWLSFAMGRRSMVTIDLSITNARLLLNFSALRPVDARLIAQSELVTILGIVQETFLKMQHQTTTETVSVVMQANGHLDNWIRTWSEWANAQEESSARYVLASLTMLLQGGRFYSNTLGLRDITKPEELLPMHMPCLRTALDAAVRIQGLVPFSFFLLFLLSCFRFPQNGTRETDARGFSTEQEYIRRKRSLTRQSSHSSLSR